MGGYRLEVSSQAYEEHGRFIRRWRQLESKFLKDHEIDPPGWSHSRAKPGYYGLGPGYVADQLRYLFDDKEIRGANFLDLGSGLGGNVAVAARMGMNAFGIEIDYDLAAGSREIVRKLRKEGFVPKNRTTRIVNGSYYLNKYIHFRGTGESEAVRVERSNKWGQNPPRKEVFFPQGNQGEVYGGSVPRFDEIDVFFAYCWDIQIPSIVEMFARYSRKDAVLFMASSNPPRRVIDKLLDKLDMKVTETSDQDTHRIFYYGSTMNKITRKTPEDNRNEPFDLNEIITSM